MNSHSNVTEDYQIIKGSGLFDSLWYLTTYRDVKNAKMDPLLHFIQFGWMEGRNPSQKFNTSSYRKEHPDCPPTTNPLIHFLGGKSVPQKNSYPETIDYSKLSLGEKIWRLNRENYRYTECKTLSVIIPTAWKCPHLTLPIIQWLLENEVQTILLNNSPLELLPIPTHELLTVIRITDPFHYSKFLNIGAKNTTSDLLLFMNDDMVITDPLWLKNLVKAFNDPEVALASPIVLNPDKTIQRAGAHFETDGRVGTVIHDLHKITAFPVIGGPCLIIRREAFNGFDEDLIVETSDDALSMSVTKAVVVHNSKIIHHESSSRKGLRVPNSDHDIFKKNIGYSPLHKVRSPHDPASCIQKC